MQWIKNTVKQLIGQFFHLFCRREAIVFESTPDFSDNTYPVFRDMVERGLGEKYTLVWSCSKDRPLPDAPAGIKYIYPLAGGLKERLRNVYYLSCARCLICCNRFLTPWRKGQTAFYLTHGVPIKSVKGYYNLPSSIQYCLSAAPGVADMLATELCIDREKMFSLGYPRNDILTRSQEPVKEMLNTTCQKVVVWYPTFRQHKNGLTAGAGKALPIIHDAQAAQELNRCAKELDVLLVLKPHFAQDLTQIKSVDLSNIRFIDDAFFTEHNTTSYGFVAGCDALITDYSSIYYDYTLCDKPIGLIWEDIDAYRENPGFAVDIDEIGKGGVKIYTLEEFKQFLEEVATDADTLREERRAIRDLSNYAADGDSTRRVTDFIVEKANL